MKTYNFVQIKSVLSARGISVKEICEVAAYGHTQRDEPNNMHVCVVGEPWQTQTATHEGIHLLQFRLGEATVEKLLSKCEVNPYKAKEYEDLSYEAQAHKFQDTQCATNVVMDNLHAWQPAPPKPVTTDIGLSAWIFGLSTLAAMACIPLAMFWPVNK